MKMLSIALSLFLLMDSLGNIPFFISFLKGIPAKRQRAIIFRELAFALIIIVLFNFVGEGLMLFLNIQNDTLQIAGGLILFILSLKMIFPQSDKPRENLPEGAEPLIVPLAIPLIAGPAVLASVMIYAKQEDTITVIGAIFIAWLASLLVLLSSSWLKTFLGSKGLFALERLMGLVLILIAVQMFMSGLTDFMRRV